MAIATFEASILSVNTSIWITYNRYNIAAVAIVMLQSCYYYTMLSYVLVLVILLFRRTKMHCAATTPRSILLNEETSQL